jgi:hypothetical protein
MRKRSGTRSRSQTESNSAAACWTAAADTDSRLDSGALVGQLGYSQLELGRCARRTRPKRFVAMSIRGAHWPCCHSPCNVYLLPVQKFGIFTP